MKRARLSFALLCLTGLVAALGLSQGVRAQEGLDPMRVVYLQQAHPVLLITFDRSGSLSFPVDAIRVRFSLVSTRSHFATRDDYHEFSTMTKRLLRLKRQASVFQTAKKVMNYWRGFHVVLAVFLVLVIVLHIATAWYLGYRWLAS